MKRMKDNQITRSKESQVENGMAKTIVTARQRMLLSLIMLLALVGVGLQGRGVTRAAEARTTSSEDCNDDCQRDLALARAATAKYHDVDVAIADGFIPVSPCIALPNGATMGFHYLQPSRVDSSVDPAEPELLLYLPNQQGKLKLVALEYFVPFDGSNPAPILFGREMDGPETFPPPTHYEMHVWAWKNNPDGLFAPFNPRLSCP